MLRRSTFTFKRPRRPLGMFSCNAARVAGVALAHAQTPRRGEQGSIYREQEARADVEFDCACDTGFSVLM